MEETVRAVSIGNGRVPTVPSYDDGTDTTPHDPQGDPS